MNNKLVFGQYYNAKSIIHNMDARIKMLFSIFFMVTLFIVPRNNFLILGLMAGVIFVIILLSRVPISKYLKSVKYVAMLLIISFIFQLIFNQEGEPLLTYQHNITTINIIISAVILLVFFLIRKYLPLKLIFFILVVIGICYLLGFNIYGTVLKSYDLKIYSGALISGSFIVLRVFVLIMSSTVLTLTTKPTDINNGLESLLMPFEKIGIKTSILAMMISISLRFIPTLFLETEKILKAQASRGVDFNEGRLKDKIVQIVSLLVPMFIISFKRAEDLADAMEARGYIPGEKRTKLVKLQLTAFDVLTLVFGLLILSAVIILRVIL